VKSRRPYLLRAMHEWISDNGGTPHIVVDATLDGVEVPAQFVNDGKVVLNVSLNATSNLSIGNEETSFNARFGGVGRAVRLPTEAVLAIYARESGEGMLFTEEEASAQPESGDGEDDGPPPKSGGPARGGKPRLKVVK
jgi:stringent starvation protein B